MAAVFDPKSKSYSSADLNLINTFGNFNKYWIYKTFKYVEFKIVIKSINSDWLKFI